MAAVNGWEHERRRKERMLMNGGGGIFPWMASRVAARKEPVVSPPMTDGCGRTRRGRKKTWRRRGRKVLWHMACYHGDESHVDPPNINLLRYFLSAL